MYGITKDGKFFVKPGISDVTNEVKGKPILRLKYSCKFPGCGSQFHVDIAYNQKVKNKHFYKFPRERHMKQLRQWKQVCRIDDNTSCSNYHLCEDHFLEKDFTNFRRHKLNYDVVPKHLEVAVYHQFQHGIRESGGQSEMQGEVADSPMDVDGDHYGFDSADIQNYPQSGQGLPRSHRRFRREGDADPYHLIEELPEMYSLITLPYLEQANLNLQWVYKILSGEEGCERIVYECPNKDDKNGFMLIRDSEWDGVSLDKLHLIAITYRPGIMSLRDLGKEHLNLLQNISNAGKVAILKKYGVIGTQLRIFLQYTPSFYHLHVHFTAMNDDICGPDFGTVHPLYSVIQNIEILPTYYQVATLSIYLRESDELFQEFETRGVVVGLPSS